MDSYKIVSILQNFRLIKEDFSKKNGYIVIILHNNKNISVITLSSKLDNI